MGGSSAWFNSALLFCLKGKRKHQSVLGGIEVWMFVHEVHQKLIGQNDLFVWQLFHDG